MTDYTPFDVVDHSGDPGRVHGLVLVCDHASNIVPPGVTPLGISDADMNRHIAWDVGAGGVTRRLAQDLGARAVLSRFSRLVIDPNRGEDDPTLVMKLYDGTIIEGNRSVDAAEVERRLKDYHRPYHQQISAALDSVEADPVLVSMHSYTPQLNNRPVRPWQIGLLWDRDDRLVKPLLRRLREEPDLFVGDNEPYSGHLAGDSMWMHGTQRGIPHVLIEIRNDLIPDAEGQQAWADRLAPILREAIAEMRRTAI